MRFYAIRLLPSALDQGGARADLAELLGEGMLAMVAIRGERRPWVVPSSWQEMGDKTAN